VIGRVARRELLDIWRDGRLRWATAAVALLFATAIAAGWRETAAARLEQEAATAAMRTKWLSQDAKHPHEAAHRGIYVFAPRGPLSFLDPGVQGYVGQTVWLEAHRQNPALYRPAGDATGAARFGPLTPAAVLQLIVPLLIIVLAAHTFAAERENGLLGFTLSLGIHPGHLFAGKALGVAAATAVAVAPGALLALGAALAHGADTLVRADLAHVALLAGSYGLYEAVVLVLALAVSAGARSVRHALVLLVGGWAVLALVIPRGASDAIGAMLPTPSIVAFTRDVEAERFAAFSAHRATRADREQVLRALLARYRVSRVEDLPINIEGVLLQADEEAGHRIFDRRWGALAARLEEQDAAYALMALAVPPLAIRSLSMALAATDGHAHRDFLRAAERYRRAMIDVLHGGLIARPRAGGRDVGGAALWARVPAFEHAPPTLRTTLRRQVLPAVGLLAWTAIAAGGTLIAVKRLRGEDG
jgi:ABC-2 type transport system permease protein